MIGELMMSNDALMLLKKLSSPLTLLKASLM